MSHKTMPDPKLGLFPALFFLGATLGSVCVSEPVEPAGRWSTCVRSSKSAVNTLRYLPKCFVCLSEMVTFDVDILDSCDSQSATPHVKVRFGVLHCTRPSS